MDDLLTDFITETRETLEAIAGELVAWEADPDDKGRLDAIFRFVHTVKGSCGFLDLPRLERLSHAAEDVLAELRAGTREPHPALVTAVLAVIDRIGELTDAMESGAALPDSEDGALIAALTAPLTAPPRSATPAPAAAAPPAKPAASRTVARSIRLPVELLDRLMAGVSDMVLARNELSRTLRDTGATGAEAAFERLSLCVGEIRDAITRTRMARIDALFSQLPRMVRDLAGQLGKQVQLETDGGDVELDREMIEMIRDPLTHIVRNSIDHGIESATARLAAGKPAIGRLRVAARQSGNQILIEAADDGAGIDSDKVVARAIERGLVTHAQTMALSPARKLDLIFLPGFSTAAQVSEISGRGVGMDVVRANIERIGGTVEIDSRPGAGLKLTMRVPLTLTIIPALIVAAGPHRFAVPRSAVDEIVRPSGEAVRLGQLGDALVAVIRGETLPVVDLRGLLRCGPREVDDYRWPVLMVVRGPGGERFALSVEAVLDHEELVVKPAAPAIMAAGIYAGTTLPDNSEPILLLDVGGIAAAAGIAATAQAVAADEPAPAAAAVRVPTLLFRDLDGAERAVRLALVERIDDVREDAVAESGGRLRVTLGEAIVPLVATAGDVLGRRLRLLQLGDGLARLAYAIDCVIDVVDAPEEVLPAAAPGPIAGVMLIDGRQVELVDGHWLFAAALREAPAATRRPVCRIAGDADTWARELLRPLLTAAGYDVAFGEGEAADVIVAPAELALAAPAAPVVRLRARAEAGPGDTSVWRYDRDGLLGAVASAAGRR